MQNSIPYLTYSAEELYERLLSSCSKQLTTEHRYQLLRSVFYRAVEQRVQSCPIAFVGMFAKVDYIIKQSGMPRTLAQLVHAARGCMFPEHNRTMPEEQTPESMFPHDLKATAILVSYIFDRTEIPETIKQHFPKADRISRWGKYETDMLRVVVTEWNEEYIWATEESEGNAIQICYGNENINLTRNGKGDWAYLNKILSKGSQLNLVRIRKMNNDNICYPELIIYEPDYLINVTTIAKCFEHYAESPVVDLLNKIKPSSNSIHIHLGNLAGQYLDDAVHHRDIPFAESMQDFFRTNAVSLVTCDEMFIPEKAKAFYDNARRQQQNIRKFIDQDLPKAIGEFDEKDVMLEPSFYSEKLGIQGRMDFLLDKDSKTVIIEQKSGKAGFVPFTSPDYNAECPVPREQHLVQIILYRALMVYEFQRYSEQFQQIMLMYSKYSQGLISTAQMPELMLRAIKIRNLLAWMEFKYASEGMGILTQISTDSINEKGTNSNLWMQYTKPEIEALLRPIRQASPLELAYYLRFQRFIAKEQMLSKIGNKTKENSGFASIWHDTLDDKRNAGNIYDSLSIKKYLYNGTAVTGVILGFKSSQNADTSNFRIGDIVILYPYCKDSVPNACQQMVHRAIIASISPDELELHLRNTQTNKHIFASHEDYMWAVEHDMMDATESSLYRAMHSFLSASKERRNLILSQRLPTIDQTAGHRGEYGEFNDLITRANQAQELFIVIGPPGTGKTSFGLVNILNEELLSPDGSVLLLSYTNRAVDEICSKLTEENIDFIRIGSEHSCPAQYKEHLLNNRVQECRKGTEVRNMLLAQRVICGTTASLNSAISLLRIKHFSLAIVDEASQILEPHLIGLLSSRHQDNTDSIRKFVFIGDHKQLPAVVQQSVDESIVTEPELNAIGLTDCRLSLFERLLTNFRNSDGQYDPKYVYMLKKQGRMHRDIAVFPSNEFYGGKLDIVPLPHQVSDDTHPRLAFIPSAKPEFSASDKTNIEEAEQIAAMVVKIYRLTEASFDVNQTIGVIVPYRNQISTIRNAIDRHGIPTLHNITIDTVERYQGSQRDWILYGFTIQHQYQLNFLTSTSFIEDGAIIDRKLNVAMTRARLHLIIFGNPLLLQKNPLYAKLLDYECSPL